MCDEEDIELEGELTSDTTFDFSSEWDNREIFGDCDTGSVVDSCSIRFRGQGVLINGLSVDDDGDGATDNDGDCDDTDASLNLLDVDGDGVDTCGGDCADEDPAVFPGAPEVECDGTDNDCDAGTSDTPDGDGDGDSVCDDCDDTDASLNLADADGDGVASCGGDCDDAEPLVSPAEGEIECDGLDNDCDPSTEDSPDGDGDGDSVCVDCDDGDPDQNLADADGDGISTCSGDCEDGAAQTYPGAAEICYGSDNDCDGSVPGDEIDDDQDGAAECEGDCDDADAGWNLDDLDADGWSTCAGDCDDQDSAENPDAAELCDLLDNDCDGAVDEECFSCDLWIPADLPTINDAIDQAPTGATVCVSPGVYVESLAFQGAELHIIGVGGPGATVLDGAGVGSTIWIDAGEGPDLVLEGLRVQGGSAVQGGGIWIDSASPTLTRLVITGNQAADEGGGVAVNGAASPAMSRCLVEGNSAAVGGGVAVLTGAEIAVTATEISNNTASGRGGGLYAQGASLNLEGSRFEANEGSDGGGLSMSGGAADLRNLRIVGNLAHGNGGGVRGQGADLDLAHVLVSENTAMARGGAVYLDSCTTRASHNRITGNWGVIATLCLSNGTLSMSSSDIVGNTSDNWGTVYASGGAQLDIENTQISSNVSGGNGALLLFLPSSIDLEHVNVWGNTPANYSGMNDQTGTDGNLSVDPQLLDIVSPDATRWDLHLDAQSPLVDAGRPDLADPDLSTSDIGGFGGPDAAGWDLDRDGDPSWWQPGPYDPVTYPALGLDCDDLDPTVGAVSGCGP